MLVMTRLGPPPDKFFRFRHSPPRTESRRCNIPNLRDETTPFVIHDDDAAPRHGGDIGGAAASRQTNALAIFFYPVRVEVAEAVEFSAADEAEIDPAALEQVHDVIQAAASQRPRDVWRIAHRKYGLKRGPVAHDAIFENPDRIRGMEFLGDGKPEKREAHADEDFSPSRISRAAATTISSLGL